MSFCSLNPDINTFACNANDITLVSLGIAAGGFSLLFVIFLLRKVRFVYNCEAHTVPLFLLWVPISY